MISRSAHLIVVLIAVHAANAEAHASPLAVALRGTNMIIDVADVDADGALVARGDRLEIPLRKVGEPSLLDRSDDDELVRRVQLVTGTRPRLIVQLRHSRHTTERYAQLAVVEKNGDSLRVSLPRTLPPERADSEPAPRANIAPATAENVIAPTHVIALAAAPVEASARDRSPEPAPKLGIASASPLAPSAATLERIELADEPARVTNGSLLVFAGALFVGVLALVAHRYRRRGPAAKESIRVLATKALSGRAQVILLETSGRELLVSVSEHGVRLLGRWSTETAPTTQEVEEDVARAIPTRNEDRRPRIVPALSVTDTTAPNESPASAPMEPRSRAVVGLIKLRERATSELARVAAPTPRDEEAWVSEFRKAQSHLSEVLGGRRAVR